MKGKSNEDMVILNGWWFYRDNLISLDTFLKVIEDLKELERKRQEEILRAEEEIVKVSTGMGKGDD